MKIGLFVLKCAGLWLVLLAGQMASGLVVAALSHATPPEGHDGPLTVMQALPVIAALHAVALGALAATMTWTGWRKAAALFVVYYMVATGLSMIEAVFFNPYLKLDNNLIIGLAAGDVVKALLGAGAAVLLWRDGGNETRNLGGLLWKLPLLSLLYVAFYYGAGALIAWQGAALRAYYDQGAHIDQSLLVPLQVARGLIWASLAMILAKGLGGTRLSAGALTGLAFALFMAVSLLLPNGFMPWEVRKFHLVEIMTSNFLYGLLAVWILTIGLKGKSVSA